MSCERLINNDNLSIYVNYFKIILNYLIEYSKYIMKDKHGELTLSTDYNL